MLDKLVNFFLVRPEAVKHPFVMKQTSVPIVEEVEEVDNPEYEDTDWGGTIVKAKVENHESGIEWSVEPDGKNRLKGVELDVHDWTIIRRHGIAPDKYKLTKPYVLAKWKYKEIAVVLGYSESWVQRIAPRVKDAQELRGATTPTPASERG